MFKKLNNNCFLLILVFLLISCKREKVIIKDKDGNVVEKYFVDKKEVTKKIGNYERYYANGTVMEKMFFKDGKQDGKRELFFENGKIMVEENYKNGQFEGKYISYFENGKKETEGQYANNLMTGNWKKYSNNTSNSIKEENTFKDGHITGAFKEYAVNGKIFLSGNKIELMEGFDVYDGEINMYDTLNGTLLKKVQFSKGKQVVANITK